MNTIYKTQQCFLTMEMSCNKIFSFQRNYQTIQKIKNYIKKLTYWTVQNLKRLDPKDCEDMVYIWPLNLLSSNYYHPCQTCFKFVIACRNLSLFELFQLCLEWVIEHLPLSFDWLWFRFPSVWIVWLTTIISSQTVPVPSDTNFFSLN